MTQTRIWHLDSEQAALVDDFARACGHAWEEAAWICLVNGMSYALTVAIARGSPHLGDVLARVEAAQQALSAIAPVERHSLPTATVQRRPN